MKFIEDISIAYTNNDIIFGIPARNIFSYSSIYICPMVNPDGVDLVNGDVSKDSIIFSRVQNIANSFPSIPFPSGWKANIRGVGFEKSQPIYKSLVTKGLQNFLFSILIYQNFFYCIKFFLFP